MSEAITRRRVLERGLMLGAGALALAAAPKAAYALSLQPMDGEATRLYATRCTTSDTMHDEILRELQARLDGRPLSPAEQAVVRDQLSASCPLCGCRLSLADAKPEEPSRF